MEMAAIGALGYTTVGDETHMAFQMPPISIVIVLLWL